MNVLFSLVDLQLKKYSYATSTFSLMQLICPPKFCIIFVFNFSWVLQLSQEELKTINAYAKFWGALRYIMGNVEAAYWLKHIVEGISANSPVT